MKDERQILVYFDGEQVEEPLLMGTLIGTRVRGKEIFSFEFNRGWLQDKRFRSFDPDLTLYNGRQYAPTGKDNFGIFLDSTPDRWGRVLLERREYLNAKTESRPVRNLAESDFLLGVYDGSRMGALRFKSSQDGPFLDSESKLAIPAWTSLRELEEASLNLESEPQTSQSKWVRMLVAPGSSLGGARPKANVQAEDGSLWIAKFPSQKDRIDVGAWEAVCMNLAAMSGLHVSEFKAEKFGDSYHTFLSKRFDRTKNGRRIHFTSAMTLLGYCDGENSDGASYLELAEWIAGNCAEVDKNLREMFRRVAFNVAISNCDDHLRNHGFLYTSGGWTLSPAYDLTPNPLGSGLKLNIDEHDSSLDLQLVKDTAPFYGIAQDEATQIIDRIITSVSTWRKVASRYGITKSEQDKMASAFTVSAVSLA